MIMPVIKKEEGEKLDDYRGIMVMTAIYKVYVLVLAERLRVEIEDKELILQNQTGFRNEDCR